MSFSDSIGDLLTRIRNAHMAKKTVVRSPASKLRARLLEVLIEEGYIRGYKVEEIRAGIKELVIELKYYEQQPVIQGISRVSKPGRRIYKDVDNLPRVFNGMGIAILSTSKGVISDAKARELGVGGEVLCHVY
ncbi:MAG: 30S ribosomal protein S8 [Alphaproteobacteria bacterium]|nr:30S ribosomal protein S8 [Alphaproteobacteria bacterium]OJV45056.1 MAG: 30S ribosomal protein S8 [Alphaproteobacteria bacterium 43-37]